MPCVKCGAELREGAKFCSECGSTQEKAKCANCQHEVEPRGKILSGMRHENRGRGLG